MDKEKLLNKMRGINGWIEQNPQITEPNMYEMIDCVTALGIIAREENVSQRPNKFPEPGSDLSELYVEWNKMYKARLGNEVVNDPKFSVNRSTNLYSYFMNLNMSCCTGEFEYPENQAERREFLECVRKVGSVSLYINQQRLQNPNFIYDNKEEYETLMSMVKEYERYMPAHYQAVIDDISASMVRAEPQNPGGDDEPSI